MDILENRPPLAGSGPSPLSQVRVRTRLCSIGFGYDPTCLSVRFQAL